MFNITGREVISVLKPYAFEFLYLRRNFRSKPCFCGVGNTKFEWVAFNEQQIIIMPAHDALCAMFGLAELIRDDPNQVAGHICVL
jgi:hypothetical protein